jgi:hypothetical protein
MGQSTDGLNTIHIIRIFRMRKKTITIREEQDTWVSRSNLNLSRFVQDRLDEHMGPGEEELEAAYRRTAERDARVNGEWNDASREANRYLGESPEIEDSDADDEEQR